MAHKKHVSSVFAFLLKIEKVRFYGLLLVKNPIGLGGNLDSRKNEIKGEIELW